MLTLKPKPPSVKKTHRHPNPSCTVTLAPQTSAVQSRKSVCVCVCPQLVLPSCTSSKASRKLHLLPASLVSTLPVWNRRFCSAGAPPNPAPACCDTAVYVWRESEWVIRWGSFHLRSFSFHCSFQSASNPYHFVFLFDTHGKYIRYLSELSGASLH